MSLDGTSSPPITPPATPTSPTMSNNTLIASDTAKAVKAESTIALAGEAPVKAEVVMVATPPPSPPPAPVSTALPHVTPFPTTSVSDDLLSASMADEDLDDGSTVDSLSTQVLLTESVPTQTESANVSIASCSAEATTFFDDMINAPQPPANILTLSPTKALPDVYHEFFDNHPELYDSDQASDLDMDLDLDDYSPAVIRARTMADLRQAAVTAM